MENNFEEPKKKRGPKGPIYENGCRKNPNSKSYQPNYGCGRGKVKVKQYKNKMYEKIPIQEYNELLEIKQKYFELTNPNNENNLST